MAMSRANYIRFAHILAKNNVNWDSSLVSDLCSYFQEDNASFDWDRFCLAIQSKRNYNLTPETTKQRYKTMTTNIVELMQVITATNWATKHNRPSNRCVSCKDTATIFKDELSKREFGISGLCQACQDKIFIEEI